MLVPAAPPGVSGWQQLKHDPKKPTNTEVRQYLEHLQWLKSWATQLPAISHIPVVKRSQFVHEARALDVADMRLVANLAILHNVEAMTGTLKEMQREGFPIDEEILAGLAPYRTEHINRYGDYTLDLERTVPPMNYKTRILQ